MENGASTNLFSIGVGVAQSTLYSLLLLQLIISYIQTRDIEGIESWGYR